MYVERRFRGTSTADFQPVRASLVHRTTVTHYGDFLKSGRTKLHVHFSFCDWVISCKRTQYPTAVEDFSSTHQATLREHNAHTALSDTYLRDDETADRARCEFNPVRPPGRANCERRRETSAVEQQRGADARYQKAFALGAEADDAVARVRTWRGPSSSLRWE